MRSTISGAGLLRWFRLRLTRPAMGVGLAAFVAVVAPSAGARELRIGLPRLPPTPDPASVGAGSERAVLHLVFQGLVELGERGELQPGLATQWTVSRDSLTWIFRLRPDVRFSNGAPLTSDIVAASLGRHLTPPPRDEAAARETAGWTGVFRGPSAVIREVRVGEPGTIQIHLKAPFSPLLAVLAHPALAIVLPQNESDVPFLGTGPYRVSERTPTRQVLEAVASFAGPPPRSDRLIFQEIADDPAGIGGLAPGGALDVYFPQAPPAWAGLGLQVLSGPTWQVGLLALRSDDGVLAQKAVRQAVALSLDPTLMQPVLTPWAMLRRSLLPPGAWAAPDAASAPHDPDRARRLVADARVGNPTLTLLAPGDRPGPDLERLADAVRISLAVAGLQVQVRTEAGEAFPRALRQGEGELALHETALDLNDPHFALTPLLGSSAAVRGVATNVAFYRSALADSILRRASQLSFRLERLRLYQRLQAHVADEVPYVPLFVRLHWALARPGVRDLQLDPSGSHRLDRAWIEPGSAGAPPPPAR